MHIRKKKKLIAIHITLALASGSALANTVILEDGTVKDKLDVSLGQTAIVQGAITVDDRGEYNNGYSTIFVSGSNSSLDLGNGSKVTSSKTVPETKKNSVIGIKSQGRFTANNLTVNGINNQHGVDADSGSSVNLKGLTSINLQEGKHFNAGLLANNASTLTAENVYIVVNAGEDETTGHRYLASGITNAAGSVMNITGNSDITVTSSASRKYFTAGIVNTHRLESSTTSESAQLTMNNVNLRVQDENSPGVIGILNEQGSTFKANDIILYVEAAHEFANGISQQADAIGETGNTSILIKVADGVTGRGISNASGSSLKVNGDLDIKFTDDSYHSSPLYFIYTGENAKTELNGNTTLGTAQASKPANIFAIHSLGETTLKNHQLVAYGDIYATEKGKINLELTDNSYLLSAINKADMGEIELSLSGNNSRWQINGDSHLNTLTLSSSSMEFLPDTFKTLTIDGDYHGDNGKIVMNTQLAGDGSASDRIIVKGNTSGNTQLAIKKIAGNGAETDNGILLIEVNGTSNGIFTQQGRTTAGLYDYFLRQKDKNWYLVSYLEEETPPPDNGNGDNGDNGDNGSNGGNNGGGNSGGNGGNNGNTDESRIRAYRPESASYIANLAAANKLFITSMYGRQSGQRTPSDKARMSSFWLRQGGGHARFTDISGQLKTKSNSYVLQMGGDIAQWKNSQGSSNVGMMAGYGNNHNKTRSTLTGYRSKAEINGYSMGVYGSWFNDQNRQQGAWLDSWLQYNWFDSYVTGEGLPSEKYRLKGFSAALEAGYIQPAGQYQNFRFWLEPHAQAVFMDVKDKAMNEIYGTRVKGTGDGNILARIGLRSWMASTTATAQATAFRPWLEANWLHNSRAFGVNMNNGGNQQSGAKESVEIKVGVTGQPVPNLQLSGEISQQRGSADYIEMFGVLQVSYAF